MNKKNYRLVVVALILLELLRQILTPVTDATVTSSLVSLGIFVLICSFFLFFTVRRFHAINKSGFRCFIFIFYLKELLGIHKKKPAISSKVQNKREGNTQATKTLPVIPVKKERPELVLETLEEKTLPTRTVNKLSKTLDSSSPSRTVETKNDEENIVIRIDDFD